MPQRAERPARSAHTSPSHKRFTTTRRRCMSARPRTSPTTWTAARSAMSRRPRRSCIASRSPSSVLADRCPRTSAAPPRLRPQYLGVPYVFGGESPAGFDCSGLVAYVFAQFGISLPHSSMLQGEMGTRIPYSQALPGDVVVMHGGSHVGIYIGGWAHDRRARAGSCRQQRRHLRQQLLHRAVLRRRGGSPRCGLDTAFGLLDQRCASAYSTI
ncbi:MAG: NlpC/P60 family protein [Galbitalea sp.]